MKFETELVLCDLFSPLVAAWKREFRPWPDVTVVWGDLLDVAADAYVSPANSFGIMDGGIDAALRARFPRVEAKVQELPVGQAVVVETDDGSVPYLICAPTMIVPSRVGNTDNAYRAMSAVLRALDTFGEEIQSVVVPGMCTGVGGMEPEVAASQMARAYADWR